MNNTKQRDIQISNMRLWGENPRYTEHSKISINNIGQMDFVLKNDVIVKDIYPKNYTNYIMDLLSNSDSIKLTLDLIESMSTGFDSDLDDIFVVEPKGIANFIPKDENFDYINKIYYVVEGNRRLMCIDLLKNSNNSREIISDLIEKKEDLLNNLEKSNKEFNKLKIQISFLKKIQYICYEFDKNPKIFYSIQCKVLDYDYYISLQGNRHLNKILNSRHFGIRKGKLNWPRGLILKKIFKLVQSEITLNPNIEIRKLHKNIEDFIGKKITSSDINAALLVTKSIECWNEKNPDKKINWKDTESGDIEESLNIIIYSDEKEGEKISSTEDSVGLYVSSLELAKNNIKIYNENFEIKRLSNVLIFNFFPLNINNGNYIEICVKNEEAKNEKSLTKQEQNEILYLIIEAVKKGEVNTRPQEEVTAVGSKLRDIIFPTEIMPKEKILSLSIEQISKIEVESLEKSEKNKEMISIVNNVKEIIKNVNSYTKNEIHENILIEVLNYIWQTEYSKIVKYKKTMTITEIPTFIFSTCLRTTIEFVYSLIYLYIILEYLKNYSEIPEGKWKTLLESTYASESVNNINLFFWEKGESDFLTELKKINNNKLREDMIKDLINLYYLELGYWEFNDTNINLSFFKKEEIKWECINKLKYQKSFNGTTLLRNWSDNDFNTLQEQAIKNNFFNLLSTEEKAKKLFYMLNQYRSNFFDVESEREVEYKKIINRFIHKPISAFKTYKKDVDSLETIEIILEYLKNLERDIFDLLS